MRHFDVLNREIMWDNKGAYQRRGRAAIHAQVGLGVGGLSTITMISTAMTATKRQRQGDCFRPNAPLQRPSHSGQIFAWRKTMRDFFWPNCLYEYGKKWGEKKA